MPYTTEWVLNNSIIKTRIASNMSPERKEAKDALINQLLAQSEKQSTHLILDCSDLNIPAFRNWQWIHNTRLGWVVLYGIKNPILRFGVTLGMQLLGVRAQIVDDYESAIRFLQEVDITLSAEGHLA